MSNLKKRWKKIDKALDKLNEAMSRYCNCAEDLDLCGKDVCGKWDQCMFIEWVRFRDKIGDALVRRRYKEVTGESMQGSIKWCEEHEEVPPLTLLDVPERGDDNGVLQRQDEGREPEHSEVSRDDNSGAGEHREAGMLPTTEGSDTGRREKADEQDSTGGETALHAYNGVLSVHN